MCRYAFVEYKPHFACFNCRKTFKRRLLRDISSESHNKEEFQLKEAICPECGELMADMGMDFQAPKRTDMKAWRHIQVLHSVEITFHSCGCAGPAYVPNTKETLIEHLKDRRKDFLFQLDGWRQLQASWDPEGTNKNWNILETPAEERRSIEDAKNYWIGRLKEIDEKLARVQSG